MAQAAKKRRLYVGVDVGGTKVLAALVKQAGQVIDRQRISTPRGKKPTATVDAVIGAIEDLLAKAGVSAADVAGIGLAIPGVVDPDAGRIVVTPNMDLTGVEIVEVMRKRLDVPIALGNDVNLGTLGEKWLGTGREADSVVGIFVGTGIGGGIFTGGALHRGHREAAAEIGHLVMEIGGPKCGCGGSGCFEAIASRTAMDRDIRAAIAAGRPSIVTELLADETSLIRSGVLRKALARGDEVVTEVMTRAAEVMGHACLSIRHLIDPEVIVFGGGVIEACGYFMLPIIEKVIEGDPLAGARPGGRILESSLGDDAVIWGAVALAQQAIGRNPFRKTPARKLPSLEHAGPNKFVIGGKKKLGAGAYVCCDGRSGVSARLAEKAEGEKAGRIGVKAVAEVCQPLPSVLFVGAGAAAEAALSARAESFLHFRGIEVKTMTNAKAVAAYNKRKGRKAILLPAE